jgi:hypothetical protein
MLSLLSRFLLYQDNSTLDFGVYSNYGMKQVADTRESDELYILLDAANQFEHGGNPALLEKCLKSDRLAIPQIAISKIDELLRSMRKFYDNMALCKVDHLEDSINDLHVKLNDANECLEAMNRTPDSEHVLDSKLLIFHRLISRMINRKTLFGGEGVNYLQIINWCCENDLIQQAVTIYEEKYPQYLFDQEFIRCSDENAAAKEVTDKRSYEQNKKKALFYSVLMAPKADGLNELTEALKKLVNLPQPGVGEVDELSLEKHAREVYKFIQKFYNANKKSEDPDRKKFVKKTRSVIEKELKITKSPQKKEFLDYVGRIINDPGGAPASTEKIINQLINHQGDLKSLLGTVSDMENVFTKKFAVAEHCVSDEFNPQYFELNVSKEMLQKIMYDYIYFKSVRNVLNHASDQELLSDGQKMILKEQGFNVDEITVERLKKDLCQAVSRNLVHLTATEG